MKLQTSRRLCQWITPSPRSDGWSSFSWLVVWNMTFMTSHSVGNVIIPSDEVIFFRGVGIPPTRIVLSFSWQLGGYPLFQRDTSSVHGKFSCETWHADLKISTPKWHYWLSMPLLWQISIDLFFGFRWLRHYEWPCSSSKWSHVRSTLHFSKFDGYQVFPLWDTFRWQAFLYLLVGLYADFNISYADCRCAALMWEIRVQVQQLSTAVEMWNKTMATNRWLMISICVTVICVLSKITTVRPVLLFRTHFLWPISQQPILQVLSALVSQETLVTLG